MAVKDKKSDRLRRWILANTPSPNSPKGLSASEYKDEFPDISLPRVSNVLVEMMSEGILTRRKNQVSRYEYFLLEYHDPDDYILAKHSLIVLNNRFSYITGRIRKAEAKARQISELARFHQIQVECSCGKRISIQVEGKVIDCEDISEGSL
jgi:hypothetical protein